MEEKRKARSRKKKPFPAKAVAAGVLMVIAAAGGAIGYYVYRGRQYETVFFPCTVINGFDASERTVGEVEEMIASELDDYVLTLVKRGGETEQIAKDEINLHSEFDGSLERYLSAQEPLRWWEHQKKVTEYEIEAMIAYDEELLSEKIDSLDMFDESKAEKPGNAYLSDYISGEGYKVLEGEPGTVLDKEKVAAAIKEAVERLETKLVLEDLDVYEKAAVTTEDPELNEIADRLNKYVNMTVTYEFGEKEEVLDGDIIVHWISMGEDKEVSVNQEAVTAYVKDLAAEYDTAYKEKKLQTSYGGTVEISKGFYGWQIDQKKEAEELYEILLSGESQVREPVYKQTAASHGENDYGDTYVEINLTAQHLHFYKDGQLVVESDFVSGNAARGYDTPSGAYPLTYKQRNAVLKGATYRTPVSYWMPFNRNIGMHDANWRGSFGGSIYKTNGSHGCINLPVGVAKTIFENIETGMPVLCYRLDGTENKPVKTGTAGKAAGNPAPETAPVETVPVETAAAETAAPETAPLPEESGAVAPPETETAKAEESSKETGATFPWDAGPGVESWNSGEGQEESVEMGPGV